MAKEDENEDATSEEYEDAAIKALDDGQPATASVYATLALAATLRESTFVLADILLDEGAEEESEVEGGDDN